MQLADLLGAPTLDLHGYDVHGAVFELDAFCERAWARNVPVVKVVHGRGSGKLRTGILGWVASQAHLCAEDSTLVGETGAILYIERLF